jgi:hypothetical protein
MASTPLRVFVCREQDPDDTREPPRSVSEQLELDLSKMETQRCVGEAMGQLAERLGVRTSQKASTLVGWLARAELGAWIGSSSQADKELARPEWSWLGPPGDPYALGSLGIVGTCCSRRSRHAPSTIARPCASRT